MAKNPKKGATPGTQATQPSAPTAAAPAPAAAAELPKQPHQNGVTRPKDGTATGTVWQISDELSKAKGEAASRGEVVKEGLSRGLNQATITTQYGRWRKFHGLAGKLAPATAGVAAGGADVEIEEDEE